MASNHIELELGARPYLVPVVPGEGQGVPTMVRPVEPDPTIIDPWSNENMIPPKRSDSEHKYHYGHGERPFSLADLQMQPPAPILLGRGAGPRRMTAPGDAVAPAFWTMHNNVAIADEVLARLTPEEVNMPSTGRRAAHRAGSVALGPHTSEFPVAEYHPIVPRGEAAQRGRHSVARMESGEPDTGEMRSCANILAGIRSARHEVETLARLNNAIPRHSNSADDSLPSTSFVRELVSAA